MELFMPALAAWNVEFERGVEFECQSLNGELSYGTDLGLKV